MSMLIIVFVDLKVIKSLSSFIFPYFLFLLMRINILILSLLTLYSAFLMSLDTSIASFNTIKDAHIQGV